ncbi:hypothetical protein K2173_011834 [Erythroxylum novogranatense]|uniref:Ubiquitin-like protease family profile domain-containing protein n=1 Tax=Erythroxylum novogranatense TaxID=1862640 RepID=A0AAV8SLA4_9ROSI|nr:hypothetical protein K2173_011834 [Erythroxylum novogranatense]
MRRKGGERVEEAEVEEEGEAIVLRDTSSPEADHVGARSRKRISKTQAPSSHTFRSSRRSKCKLDTKLFESHLENLWCTFSQAKKIIFTCMDSLWFAMYANVSSRPKVLGWIKNKRIFSKKYVLVPIVRWDHWSLLIFCHFGDALQSENATPCMLLLDSLKMADPKRLEPEIRRLVLDIYKSEGRTENNQLVSRIPLLVPKVPQQRNDEECGNYVLYFIYLFVQDAPENFSTKEYPYFMNENWFTPESVDDFCKKLQSSSRSDVENCP